MPASPATSVGLHEPELHAVELLSTLTNHLMLCRDTAGAILYVLDAGEAPFAPIGTREEVEGLLTKVSAAHQRCTVVLTRVSPH